MTKKKTTSRAARDRRLKEARYTIGTNFLLNQSKFFVSFVHFGIRLDMPLNPSAKIDLKKDFTTEYVNIGIGQKLIYYRQEGFQEISQLIFNKKLTSMIQTDLVNSLVWTDENDKFTFRHNLVLTHDLGEERGIAYSIGATASLSPTYYYSSYDASISYRQLLFKDWLYGTLGVGVDFAKENRFNDEKYVQIRFDIFFRE